MPRLVSVLVLIAGLNPSPYPLFGQNAKAQAESQEPVPSRFHEVKFISEIPLPPVADDIRAALQTLPPELNKDGVEEFLERARDAWQHKGYFKAEIANAEFKAAGGDPNVIDATLHVIPGLQYKTGEITFHNNTRFTAVQLRSMIPINRGEIFDTHKIGSGDEAIRRAYGEQGFINLAIVPSTSIDDTAETVSVDVDIEEGAQFHVRKFEILGIDAEQAKNLKADSGLAPGSVFYPQFFEKLCERRKDIFPPGTAAADCSRVVDDRAGVVDLKIDLASVADEEP